MHSISVGIKVSVPFLLLFRLLTLESTMLPRRRNSPNTISEPYRLVLTTSPQATAQNSPQTSSPVLQSPSSLPLHRLQPPPAPRLQSIPLPNLSPTNPQGPTFSTRGTGVFPVDLLNDIDFEVLARSVSNFRIPSHTTIYVAPSSRDRFLFHIDTGDRPLRVFSILRRVQSILRAPLSLQVYQTQVSPATQESVRQHFLSRNGPDAARLWRNFLNGFEHGDGPRGEILLQGHSDMWGFSQDHGGEWVIHVDVPFLPAVWN
ncbi:hypothetical protein R3P38DRAFT_617345 [Favolaschia claudopus]|uniref:Uncharacterized protein n=1 Tax=Favolaschia claudopus TaxID=2862362 RepID=A0AAW0CCD6_9AGAR